MDKRGILRSACVAAILGWLFLAPPDLVSQIMAAVLTFSTTYACGRLLRRFVNPSNIVRKSQALATVAMVVLGCISSFALATALNALS